MMYRRILAVALALIASASPAPASAAVIASTASGGYWSQTSTWAGGVVPSGSDDVVILGPVLVDGLDPCHDLTVQPAGSVNAAIVPGPPGLQILGSVDNRGAVGTVDSYYLEVEIAGDIHNAGAWKPSHTRVTGTGTRYLSQDPGQEFTTDLTLAAGASGDLIATTAVSCGGNLDVTGGRLILQPNCPLTLPATSFRGALLANGNEVHFASWSYLVNCTIDDMIMVGDAKASVDVAITTRLVVMDELTEGGISGGGFISIEGDLVNHGYIHDINYSLNFNITGNIVDDGTIDVATMDLQGVGVEHHLSMSPDAVMLAPIFLAEIQESTLIADTPLRIGGAVVLGTGTLILPSASSLELAGYGSLESGTVLANGSEISVTGFARIGGVTVDQGVLGDANVVGQNHFTSGLTVTGTVRSQSFQGADIIVDGTLDNEGTLQDGTDTLRITAHGDLVNHGSFTNGLVTIAGTVDQFVGAGSQGLAVATFVIESELNGASYQWYRDGEPIPSASTPSLAFAGVTADEYGVYTCVVDGQTTRSITIAETSNATGVPGRGVAVSLEQNSPNPFNPTTMIAFRIDVATPVSLTVYDMAGRRVASLAHGVFAAGRHEVNWQPRDLPSGTYVYRLRAGATELNQKCTLLK